MKTLIKSLLTIYLLSLLSITLQAQVIGKAHTYSRADSLFGGQHAERTAYDIQFYHLNIRVNPEERFISGENLFRFKATRDFTLLQFDLFENMQIDQVIYKGKKIAFSREYTAVFINFPETIRKGQVAEFTVKYSGKPTIAKQAPWDGGFVYRKDAQGKPWVGVAVQGVGASLWWPNKDQQADEVDSMRISVAVPKGLMNISNGKFEGKKVLDDGYTQFNWFVSYPINNYNVTLNIGDYTHIKSSYQGLDGPLPVDYYVLREHAEKAKVHFARNVPQMLSCFESWFGPYPFYRDGYKLVEAAYLGMEHQSAVAYGNHFENGYLGRDLSGTGHGDSWDYIIVHESGHEWFGNNITSKDIADSWIHEGFTTYTEGIFVECQQGKEAGNAYIKGLRKNIRNNAPMIGEYGVNASTTGDIYYKGANILQTLRTVINDDTLWKQILTGMNREFSLQTVSTQEVIDYLSKSSGIDFTAILREYLEEANVPTLELKEIDGKQYARWKTHRKDFDLPIRVKHNKDKAWTFMYPKANEWTLLQEKAKDTFKIDTDWMYFNVKEMP